MKYKRVILPLAALLITGAAALPALAEERQAANWFNPTGEFEYAGQIVQAFINAGIITDATDMIEDARLSELTNLTLTPGALINATPNAYPINIEFLHGLQSLEIPGNNLYDISFVGCMPNLINLNLSGNNLSGLDWRVGVTDDPNDTNKLNQAASYNCTPEASISDLQNLIYLNLSNNTFLDNITPLAGLQNLQQLNLSGSSIIRDITPALDLPALTMLNLTGTSVITTPSPEHTEEQAGAVFTQREAVTALVCERNVNVILPEGQSIDECPTTPPEEPPEEPRSDPGIVSHDDIGNTGRTVEILENPLEDSIVQALIEQNEIYADFIDQIDDDPNHLFLVLDDREHTCEADDCAISITLDNMLTDTTYYLYHYDDFGNITPMGNFTSDAEGFLNINVEGFSGNVLTTQQYSIRSAPTPDGGSVITITPSTGGAPNTDPSGVTSEFYIIAILALTLIATGTTVWLKKRAQKED